MNELSVRYVQEDRDFRKDLIRFRKYLSGKSPNTLNQRITMVKRFLEDNGIEFPRVFLGNLHGKGGEAISDERVPTAEEIRRIVEYMPIHAKTLTLVLASSGMRVGEALQLRVEDVDLESESARINIRASYTKTGRKRFTFISTEAREQLEEWLRYREEFIELSKRRFGAKKRLVDRSDRLFPFSFNNFNQIWANALRKAGLYERDRETGRITLRPHNLRKFFRTHGRWENPDVPEALMGHISGVRAIYARFDQAEEYLREQYLKHESNFSIYEHTRTLVKLKERVERQREDLKELTTNLSVENLRLKREISRVKDMIGNLAERLGRTESFIEMLGYEVDWTTGEVIYDPDKDVRREVLSGEIPVETRKARAT